MRFALVLVAIGTGLAPAGAIAAGSRIDPEPGSAFLGDILDREMRSSRETKIQQSVWPDVGSPARVSVEPRIPRHAVTVLVPGARPRR